MSSADQIRKFLETEQKIIHLMLKDRRAIDDMLQSGYSAELFDDHHRRIVENIYYEFLNGNRLLTAEGYRHALISSGYKANASALMEVFAKCDIKVYAELDDLGHLKRKLIDAYVARKSNDIFGKLTPAIEKDGYFKAVCDLVDQLQQSLSIANLSKTSFVALDEFKDEYLRALEELAENKEAVIRCGIPEIDNAIAVGFKPQHLTLIVADVGGFKTSLMLNIALRIWEQGHNVLFVPLEMNKQDLTNRIIAHRTGVHYVKLATPELMNPDEWAKVRAADCWEDASHGKFCMLDADERSSVEQIKREIEKRAFLFKPKVVVIDYVAIMKPDTYSKGDRPDLMIGEILKSLRFLGKKHGFHIITAAQMGREAIKQLRENTGAMPDSTSIRGSHEYAADADTIFALQRPAGGEANRIKIYTLKSRHGKAGETNELMVEPACCRIHGFNSAITSATDLDTEINKTNDEIEAFTEATHKGMQIPFVAGFNLDEPEGSEGSDGANPDEDGLLGLT